MTYTPGPFIPTIEEKMGIINSQRPVLKTVITVPIVRKKKVIYREDVRG